MDIKTLAFMLILYLHFQTIVEGQDRTEIANHVINKVFNGRNCNKKVKFDKLGKVKVKLGGRLLHFICGKDSRLIGDKFSVCIDGEWSHPVPVCAYRGCDDSKVNNLDSSGMDIKNRVITGTGEIVAVSYGCGPDHVLEGGDELVYCMGRKWQGMVPKACVLSQAFMCDFENVSTPHCNWTNDSEQGASWKHHSEETLLEGTGPDFDHTYGIDGTGHYMYVDSMDAPEGAVAEMMSPWQHAEENSCLEFWYHMHGNQTNSTLVASIQTLSSSLPFEPLWIIEGNQGNQWKRAAITLQKMDKPYRVLFQATLNSRDNSDIAVDDVSIKSCDEIMQGTTQQTETKENDIQTTKSIDSTSQTSFPDKIVITDMTGAEVGNTTRIQYTVTEGVPSNVSVSSSNGIIGYLRSPDSKTPSNKTPMVLGLVIGSIVLVIGLVIGVYLIRKRRQRDLGNEDQDTRAFAYTSMGSDIPL